ncbi:MAG: hypothetical protein HYR67_14895 [Bacteroidetes bacterium]|nr:hypothetical protein [Bacteroidota bacterium]
MGVILFILFAVVIIYLLTRSNQAKPPAAIFSHWYHLIENLQLSSQEFYQSLGQALTTRNIPGIKLDRVDHHEGGVLSAKREYLRVNRKEHTFDVCAAPFGNGFFISWWLGETTSDFWNFIIKIPLVGPALLRTFRPETYYRLDTALMFQESTHAAVLEVLDSITQTKGVRALTELERKPIMNDLFKR